jgi:hypothetical protein
MGCHANCTTKWLPHNLATYRKYHEGLTQNLTIDQINQLGEKITIEVVCSTEGKGYCPTEVKVKLTLSSHSR